MRLSKSDVLVTTVVLSLVAILFYLYVQDVNRSFSVSTGSTVGSIVFKKRSATRKTSTSLGWERLRNASPVYTGDTLRTADLSEASVFFDDGTSLDILDNTMLKINFAGAVRDLEFSRGAIELGGEGSAATSIKIGNKTLTTGADSRLSLSGTGDSVTLEVAAGTATLQASDGSSQVLGVNQEARIDMATGEVALRELELIPRAPKQNARLLSAAAETPLEFVCALSAGSSAEDTAGAVFEFAADDAFTADLRTVQASRREGELVCAASLPSGVWYWRARAGAEKTSNARRLTLYRENPIAQAQPADGTEFAFRKRKPRIRFSWAEAADAVSYTLEVASDPSFATKTIRTRTNVTSIDVDSLEGGAWYWRVIPEYPLTRVGEAAPPTQRTFIVAKREAMADLNPVFPADGTLFEIGKVAEGLSFSWKPNAEAEGYELAVSPKSDLSSPVARYSCAEPYFVAKEGLAALAAKGATWYWGVRWKDDEGNFSPWSRQRLLSGVDGRLAMRAVYPPDGYTVADSLVRSLRFAWKSNVSAKTLFQVAKNDDFTDLVLDEQVTAETTFGRVWPTGTYRWRLQTFNSDGTVFLETDPRTFTVAEPFPAPALKMPAPLSTFRLRDGDPQRLEWESVKGIDYVQLELIHAGSNAKLVSIPMLTGTELEVPLGTFPDGRYVVRLQGFGMDKELSTRIIGYSGETSFYYRKLAYVELDSPADGAAVEGLAALRTGVPLRWESKDDPDTATLVLSRDPARSDVVLTVKSPRRDVVIPRLGAGTYWWTLRGSIENFDISSRETWRFDVLPIPLLPAPPLQVPAQDAVWDATTLRTMREPVFQWAPVEGANRYLFALRPEKDDGALIREYLEKTEYKLTDLKLLSRGVFLWTVEAQTVGADGSVEQQGELASSRFAVDLPVMEAPRVKSAKRVYGR